MRPILFQFVHERSSTSIDSVCIICGCVHCRHQLFNLDKCLFLHIVHAFSAKDLVPTVLTILDLSFNMGLGLELFL